MCVCGGGGGVCLTLSESGLPHHTILVIVAMSEIMIIIVYVCNGDKS